MKNILIFGDSNAWGYDAEQYIPELNTCRRMSEAERWPGLVRRMLGPDYSIIEDALNGRTVMQEDPYNPYRKGLTGLRVALDVNAPLDVVVLHLGCNELKNYFHLTAGVIAYGMEKLVQECRNSYYGYPAPKVLLLAPAPTHPDIGQLRSATRFSADAYTRSLEFGRLYRDVADRCRAEFIDCGALDFEINALDGLHYCKADHAKLAPVVAARLREMV